jgi:preprotein translocase subunit SecB
MADTPNDTAAGAAEQQAQQQQGPQISIRAQLTRSLTFSNPGALQQPEGTPSVTVNINVDAGKRDEENFMVGLRIEASSRTETQEFYSVSLDYAGVFNITNYEARVIEPLLLIECPRILFPFARRIIADATRDGGYAPLMLDPVDFVALYRRELARRAEEQGNGAAAPANAPANS